jgi:hypothetical protein
MNVVRWLGAFAKNSAGLRSDPAKPLPVPLPTRLVSAAARWAPPTA